LKLAALLTRLEYQRLQTPQSGSLKIAQEMDIRSVHCRAQDVQENGLFVAIAGFAADGHDYVDQALERGAVAVVVQRPVDRDTVVIQVSDSRRALALLSSEFYGRPSEQMVLVGITGTNGKTTTAYLIESILTHHGRSTGVIGTINYRFGGHHFDSPVTTPESIDLQRILADMRHQGVSHVVMEVSSHALALNRIDGCYLDIGVFTNLTQDHLDFHRTMDAYWQSKTRLFTESLGPENLKPRKTAVIHVSDPKGRDLMTIFDGDIITTGFDTDAAVHPIQSRLDRDGMSVRLSIPGGRIDIRSKLVGTHNLANLMSATGVGLALGIPKDTIAEGIEMVNAVPGRLEPVADPEGRYIYVDYAHTPDALDHVIGAITELGAGRIICVFGCGGDRDRSKRPEMGQIAARRCDVVVVTSDNPRTEPPLMIIEEILVGVRNEHVTELSASDLTGRAGRRGFITEPDRMEAIRMAIAAARPDDTVLIAGKGHETYQIIGEETFPFDDRKAAEDALKEINATR